MRCIAIVPAALIFYQWCSFQTFAKETVSFNRDIRPILSDTCFHCHGFDQNTREGGLRLDVREDALKAGKSGLLAIVPGKPMESEIISRIFAEDESDLMPPKKAHKELTPEQKELFRKWVEEGAKYEEHWAYTPLKKPPLPQLKDEARHARNGVDSFILEKLEKHQVLPSKEATKRDLLRRLSLDLTGLPPTPEEMGSFLADQSADAYDKQVKRLLNSPHYGERMAVWWLDVARFTDTVGYHGDQNQRIFPYRDYVIRSFNENKSFRDFTKEQLAGDLLPNPTKEQLVATGFNRLNMMTREGGAQPKEYLAKYGAERARTVATAWLGSTFGCAECHDHKFDPISQKDFYSLQAFFADVKQWGVYSDYKYSPEPELRGFNNDFPFPPEIELESPYLKKQAAKLRHAMTKLACSVVDQTDGQEKGFTEWKQNMKKYLQQHANGWAVAMPEQVVSVVPPPAKSKEKPKVVQISVVDDDGRVLFLKGHGDNTTVKIKPQWNRIASLKLELLPLKSSGGSILRRGGEGEFKVKLQLSHTVQKTGDVVKLEPAFADANLKRPRFSNGAEVIGIKEEWNTLASAWDQPHEATWILPKPVTLEQGDEFTLTLAGNEAAALRISTSPLPLYPSFGTDPGTMLAQAFATDSEDQVKLQKEAYWLSSGDGMDSNKQSYQQLFAQWLEQRGGKTWTMITQAVEEPLTVRVLPRGNWMDQSGEVTPPATPEFLPSANSKDQSDKAKQARATRLDLAEWICSDENPLTARAVVNRLWKEFFGNGLSLVVDDLGAQGEPPSHPELLDWLACEFRDSGWDLQHVIRLMVMSHTYRQSSNLRPELKDMDPDNRWLASQNPRRLEAEFVRDQALYVAGLLNLEDIGGPSVKPYQPAGYYENLQFPSRDYVADVDDRQWRRGLYMHWQRTFLHPMLANFDAPSREECTAFRPQSNTPQQALTLLNDPTFVEAARVLAERLMKLSVTGDGLRLEQAFQLVLGRVPSDSEKEGLLAFLEQQRELFHQQNDAAIKLISTGLHKRNESLDPVELAAWTSLARVMLNLHESITRY